MEKANRWRPFCCERCRMADLGDWLSASNRLPVIEDDPSIDMLLHDLPDEAAIPVKNPRKQ